MVKADDVVLLSPSLFSAAAVTVYVVAGTSLPELVHRRPSADSAPAISSPSSSVTVTLVSRPPVTSTEIGLSGRVPAAPFFGLTAICAAGVTSAVAEGAA